MKMTRHAKIKEIIDKNKVETQEDLAAALRAEGCKYVSRGFLKY